MITVPSNKVIYTFKNKMEAVEKVKSGQVFKVMTNDCFYQQITSEDQTIEVLDFDRVNPATGPIYIENAEPGDILKINILDIELENQGVAMTIPEGGALGKEKFGGTTKIAKVKEGYVHIYDLKIPIDPMIGVIGVAPSEESGEWGTETPWMHGGNMDTSEIKKGNILYLPVNQEGGLLALGDLHAIMGDGEICMTGLEINGSVTLKVDVIKNKAITWPLIESKNETMVIASGEDVDEAIENGSNQVVKYLSEGLNLDFEEAYILASLVSDIKISQVVNSKKTIRMSIPKTIINTHDIINRKNVK